MEEIHNTYRHFDWYINFIIAFVECSNNSSAVVGYPIIRVFVWANSRQGFGYWSSIYDELNTRCTVIPTFDQARIFNLEAQDFYTALYEELKLTNPELFI